MEQQQQQQQPPNLPADPTEVGRTSSTEYLYAGWIPDRHMMKTLHARVIDVEGPCMVNVTYGGTKGESLLCRATLANGDLEMIQCGAWGQANISKFLRDMEVGEVCVDNSVHSVYQYECCAYCVVDFHLTNCRLSFKIYKFYNLQIKPQGRINGGTVPYKLSFGPAALKFRIPQLLAMMNGEHQEKPKFLMLEAGSGPIISEMPTNACDQSRDNNSSSSKKLLILPAEETKSAKMVGTTTTLAITNSGVSGNSRGSIDRCGSSSSSTKKYLMSHELSLVNFDKEDSILGNNNNKNMELKRQKKTSKRPITSDSEDGLKQQPMPKVAKMQIPSSPRKSGAAKVDRGLKGTLFFLFKFYKWNVIDHFSTRYP